MLKHLLRGIWLLSVNWIKNWPCPEAAQEHLQEMWHNSVATNSTVEVDYRRHYSLTSSNKPWRSRLTRRSLCVQHHVIASTPRGKWRLVLAKTTRSMNYINGVIYSKTHQYSCRLLHRYYSNFSKIKQAQVVQGREVLTHGTQTNLSTTITCL